MKAWTPEEDRKLLDLIKQGLLTEEMAKELNRSFKSIAHRRAGLTKGLPLTYAPANEKKINPKEINKTIISTLKEQLCAVTPYNTDKFFKRNVASVKGDTLIIQLADLHAGKNVKDQNGNVIYDETIFKGRIDSLCIQILLLLDNNISKGVRITHAAIFSTGDQANGEGIYATQAFEQELAPPKQVMLVVDVYIKLILALLKRGIAVEFYGVKGNHGRLSKEADPSANWDLMSYMILEFWSKYVLKSDKFFIKYAETDYLTCKIRGNGYLLRHIAPEQADSPSGRVKFNEWARMYDVKGIVYGHWHHFGIFDVDGIRVFRGGSVVGGDGLSESMAKHSEPIQLVWGVNEKRPMTFAYAVDLHNSTDIG